MHACVSWNLIGSQESDFSTNRTPSTFSQPTFFQPIHIRVLTSANQSYLNIGFKQPINFKKNVIWLMSKNKKITYVMITLDCLNNFLHIKTKKYG
jgi:predicted lactoylglutathione lyase